MHSINDESIIYRTLRRDHKSQAKIYFIFVSEVKHLTRALITKCVFLYSKSFAETLQRVGVKSEAIMYEGRTHTDVFLQVSVGQRCLFSILFGHNHVCDLKVSVITSIEFLS